MPASKKQIDDRLEHRTMEESVKIIKTHKLQKPTMNSAYYLVYFEYYMAIALFRNDYTKPKPMELPEYLFKVSQLLKINYKIPLKPLEMTIEFKCTEASIDLQFKDETFKAKLGHLLNKKIKEEISTKTVENESHSNTDIELKYKLAKLMEVKNFEFYKDNYDYRKIFNVCLFKEFKHVYNISSEDYAYLYNRFFMGKLSIITKHKTNVSVKSISKAANNADEPFYCIFILSRGVYNLKKHTLSEYPHIITDFTKDDCYPSWMETDTVYLFKRKNISEDNDNSVTPYHKIYPIADCLDIELVDTDKFILSVRYEDHTDMLVFPNIIEAWKFYNYIRVLILNFRETRRSKSFDIKLNMRILLDDYRYEQMDNILMILFTKYNYEYIQALSKKLNVVMNDDEINFTALNEFIEYFMIAYYSNCSYAANHNKLRVFISKLHELYLKYIHDILSNPYVEVI